MNFDDTYENLQEIGRGSGGIVYRAYHKRLKKQVVLKQIHKTISNLKNRTEVDILKNLKSPYLPQVYDFIEFDGNVYTVMEYINGESLNNYLGSFKLFSQKDIIRWFGNLTEALVLLHTQKIPIVHGDIKPANIMLTDDGKVCLIDFNISAAFDGAGFSISGYTPDYAPTEQTKYAKTLMAGKNDHLTVSNNESVLDPRIDIYSLGATFYHFITGKKPINEKGVKDIKKYAPEILDSFAYVIMKCISLNAKDRFQSAEKLYDAVSNVYHTESLYKKLIHKQREILVLLLLLSIASFACIYLGIRKIIQERGNAYSYYVQQEQDARINGNQNALEEAFKKATELSQVKGNAYAEKALFLYEAGKYEEDIRFLDENAIPYVSEDYWKSSLYRIAGSCYAELQEYNKAHNMFQMSYKISPSYAEAFQEDAVVMAHLGHINESWNLLEKAEEYGLNKSDLSYTKGELLTRSGNYDKALEEFCSVINDTDNDYLTMRAYIAIDNLLNEKDKTQKTIEQRIGFLSEAQDRVSSHFKNTILERLGSYRQNDICNRFR